MQSQTTGRVQDPQGSPVPGAVVSNCLTSQVAGPDGSFSLPSRGRLIWVCPPPGWTSDRWWRRPGEGECDFVLSPAPLAGPRIAHITDLHLTHDKGTRWAAPFGQSVLDPLAGAIRNGRAGLVVVTGDVTDRGTVGELKSALKELAGIGVSFRLVPGKHDRYGQRATPPAAAGTTPSSDPGPVLEPWEQVIGPRWWSMNFQGLHLAALDLSTGTYSHDHVDQMRWLAGDLCLLPAGYPVVLLSHDQPSARFLQSLRRRVPSLRLVAVLTGRRHAPRAIKVNGALHLSTGPGIVAGQDWSPPQMRFVEWDADQLASRTVLPARGAPSRFRSSPPKWSFQARIAPSASSLHLTAHPDGIVAATADNDRAAGTLALLDERTGKVVWSWDSPQPLASAAAVNAEGSVFVQTVGGMVLRVDDGELTWMIEAADPVATWVTSTPVLTNDGGLVTEGPDFVRCLHCSDGRVRWTRQVDEGDLEMHPDGRLLDGLAVLPLTGHSNGLTVLCPRDGTKLWGDAAGSPSPRSSPVPLGDGTAVIVREGTLAERFELSGGKVRWRTTLKGPPSGASPAIIDELAMIVTADAVIHILDTRTGWLLRDHRLPATAESSGSPSTPRVAMAALAVDGFLHVITIAGEWWRLDPYHWEPVLVASLPLPVIAQPLQIGLNLVVPGREGVVLAASLVGEESFSKRLRGAAEHDAAGQSPESKGWLKALRISRF